MTGAVVYTCSICSEPSSDICVKCTKDACRNHKCERCKSCSDCCECEVPLTAPEPEMQPIADLPALPQASEEPDLNVPSEVFEQIPPAQPEEVVQPVDLNHQTPGEQP